jgi:alpha-galactosidase
LYDYVDADHVVLDEVSAGENRARLLSSVITGTCITGDDFSTHGPWSAFARRWFQDPAFLAVVAAGKAFLPLEGNVGTSPVFYRWIGGALYIAVFNFDSKPRDHLLDASRLGLNGKYTVTDLFSGKRTTLDVNLGGADATLLKLKMCGHPGKLKDVTLIDGR